VLSEASATVKIDEEEQDRQRHRRHRDDADELNCGQFWDDED